MKIDKRLIPVLEAIDFAGRYIALCRDHDDFTNRLTKYDKNFIEQLFETNGLPYNYLKGEKFFQVKELVGEFEVHFKVVPSNGFIQFLFSVIHGKERLQVAMGMWEVISRALKGEVVKKPIFTSIEELEEILQEAFSIYDDFKKGLLASQV